MKELYISPELEVQCFAPAERLAVNADDLMGLDGGLMPEVSKTDDSDFPFEIDVF